MHPPTCTHPHGSHWVVCIAAQVAVCASWTFACERDCKVPALETSERLHGDDYLLNSKLNVHILSSALSFERAGHLIKRLGMRAPSSTDHYLMKAEVRLTPLS